MLAHHKSGNYDEEVYATPVLENNTAMSLSCTYSACHKLESGEKYYYHHSTAVCTTAIQIIAEYDQLSVQQHYSLVKQ